MSTSPPLLALSQDQQDLAKLIEQLLGKMVADRYVDLCSLSSGALKLRVSKPLAAHALRELESTLRIILAVPLDAAPLQDLERQGLRDEARSHLEAMGFESEAARRAAEALKPRLNHKEQITRICERLELGADSDIARLWISLNNTFGSAHRRSFHRSLEMDDEFRAQFQQPFDIVLRALLQALQRKYLALIARVDELTQMPDLRYAVKLFAQEIPGAESLQRRFYEQLTNGKWLVALSEEGLIAEPVWDSEQDSERQKFVSWPIGDYLVRMASSDELTTRSAALRAITALAKSTHPAIQQSGLEILAALPAKEAAGALHYAIDWLNRGGDFGLQRAAEKLLQNLATAGSNNQVLELGGALLQLRYTGEQVTSIYADKTYESLAPNAARIIVGACDVAGLRLLVDLFLFAGNQGDDFKYDDYPSEPIASDEDPTYDIVSALRRIVREEAIGLIRRSDEYIRPVVALFTQHTERVCTRLALHVLSHKPSVAPELATAFLTNPALIEASWCQYEYAELATTWFPNLPREDAEKILQVIDKIPGQRRQDWQRRVEGRADPPPTPDEQREFEAAVYRDLTWRWRSVLPADRQEGLAAIVERIGNPDSWRERLSSTEASPLSAEEINALPLPKLTRLFENWRPPSDATQSVRAFAWELRRAVEQEPLRYADGALQFVGVAPEYQRELLEGLSIAVRNKRAIDWTSILAFVEHLQNQTHHSLLRDSDSLLSAAELLSSGLRLRSTGIGLEHAAAVEARVLQFARLTQEADLIDNFEEGFRRAPYFVAQRTRCGIGVELCVLFVWWLSSDKSSPIGKDPNKALDALPQIGSALEASLDRISTEGRLVRAVLGRYLTYLKFYGEIWLQHNLNKLFPSDSSLRDATWSGHLLSDRGPIDDLLPELSHLFANEIRQLTGDNPSHEERQRGTRLADYVLILHFWGTRAETLVSLFHTHAPAWLRAHAIVFAAGQAALPNDRMPSNVRQKVLEYWKQRLDSAKAASDPDRHREEIGAFAQWFARDTIDDQWLISQLIALLDAGFVPANGFMVVRRLAKMPPILVDQKVDALRRLLESSRLDRWTYLDRKPIGDVLAEALGKGSLPAQKSAREIIGFLTSRGDNSFLDLVVKR